jgi:hypothetical protein
MCQCWDGYRCINQLQRGASAIRHQNLDRLLPIQRACNRVSVKINGDFRHYPSWLFTGHGIANSADFVGPILPVRHFT